MCPIVVSEFTNNLSKKIAILTDFCKLTCITVSEILNPLSHKSAILASFYKLSSIVVLEFTNHLSNIFAFLALFCKLICIGVSEILNPLSYKPAILTSFYKFIMSSIVVSKFTNHLSNIFAILALFCELICIGVSEILNPLSYYLQF